ncbi:MAG: glycoside hydrolase family 25 protein [Eubacterium sp.]
MSVNTKKKRRKPATKKKKSKKVNIDKRMLIPLIAVFLVIVTAIAVSSVGRASHRDNPFENIDAEYLCGIDVSHHNGKIDWKKISKSTDFAIIRVGARGYEKGNIIEDTRAKENLKGANKAGIPVGVYFYTQAVTPKEAEQEAKFALKMIKKYDVSLPVFIDFEYAYNKKGELDGRLLEANLTKQENTEIINAFCSVIERAGYQTGVYASSYIYKSHLAMEDLNENCFIWVADYNDSVTYDGPYDIWQYSDKGKMEGIGSKNVDLNYWYLNQ